MPLKAPTPPTPPTIEWGDVQSPTPRIDAHQFFEVPEMPFHEGREARDEGRVSSDEPAPITEKPAPITRQEVTPEDMARDAVANGSGALTKRTITRADDDAPIQNVAPVAPVLPIDNTTSTSDNYERGQAVLREFRDIDDNRDTEQPLTTPASNAYKASHSGFFWIATIIFLVVATVIVARKFLFRKNPALKKSDIFERPAEKLKSISKNNAPQPIEKKPPVKPARLPKKDDDDKGKRFEVRI